LLSIVWIVISFWSTEAYEWLEGASILFAVLFAAVIQTSTDYSKESKFLLLANEIQQEKCKVLRGQYATTQEIRVSEVVVGDVVLLEAGDRVPADCWLIEEMDMNVDESAYFPGQIVPSEK
jgi:P-type E1-E2 ATPase